MELQQFPSWWEKLLYCPRYEVKGSQIVRRRQRSRDQGKGLFVRRSKFNFATANKMGRFRIFFIFAITIRNESLTATLFFWSKFTCDNLPSWQEPRFAVNLHPPYWAGVVVEWPATMCRAPPSADFVTVTKPRSAIPRPRRFAFGEIVLDMCITILYTWDCVNDNVS